MNNRKNSLQSQSISNRLSDREYTQKSVILFDERRNLEHVLGVKGLAVQLDLISLLIPSPTGK